MNFVSVCLSMPSNQGNYIYCVLFYYYGCEQFVSKNFDRLFLFQLDSEVIAVSISTDSFTDKMHERMYADFLI